MSHRLACRVLGHRWDFAAEDGDLVWRCRRGCEGGGRRSYDDPHEARRMALRLQRGAPGPPVGMLAALGGTVLGKRRRP